MNIRGREPYFQTMSARLKLLVMKFIDKFMRNKTQMGKHDPQEKIAHTVKSNIYIIYK